MMSDKKGQKEGYFYNQLKKRSSTYGTGLEKETSWTDSEQKEKTTRKGREKEQKKTRAGNEGGDTVKGTKKNCQTLTQP